MLLDSESIRANLEKQLAVSSRCWFYSAFFTMPAAEWIHAHRNFGEKTRILMRGALGDFVSGASGFSAIRLSLQCGWEVGFSSALHAKVYIFDQTVFATSANLTARGLALFGDANDELGLSSDLHESDLILAEKLWAQRIHMNEEIVNRLENHLKNLDLVSGNTFEQWPEDLLREERDLYCSDFPQAIDDPNFDSVAQLKSSEAYRWLISELSDSGSYGASYGKLSASLHSALKDDPTPYRRNVKELLGNLLFYVKKSALDEVASVRPNYSEVYFLKKYAPSFVANQA